MSGLLRSFVYFCFVSLMIGSLWVFAQSSTPPSLPAYRNEQDFKLPAERTHYQASAFEEIPGENLAARAT